MFYKSLFMIKLLRLFIIKPTLLTLLLTWGASLSANEGALEVAINVAIEMAQTHTPGKVVTHEKADELVGEKGAETLQPVYRVKILSQKGVMKTLLVHRLTGQVIE